MVSQHTARSLPDLCIAPTIDGQANRFEVARRVERAMFA
jgi:hypothetical protein